MESMYFNEEHQLFRESLKDFLKKEVVPHIDKWEKTGTIALLALEPSSQQTAK